MKLLHKTEGVYRVHVDYEQQKVTVSGNVDSGTLIKKLVRAGKHAAIWSQKSAPYQKQKADNKKSEGQKPNQVEGQHKFAAHEEDDCDSDYYDDDENEMQVFREKLLNQLKLQITRMVETAADGKNINAMMNVGGFHGNGGRHNNVFHGMAAGHHNNPMMNFQNRQPQMMYNRSPFGPPTTAYQYNYNGDHPEFPE